MREALANLLAEIGITIPVPLASLICGLVMVVSAMYGVKVLRVISYIAVPLLIGISVYGLIEALTGDSLQIIQNYKPAAVMNFTDGLAVTLGSFALGQSSREIIRNFRENGLMF